MSKTDTPAKVASNDRLGPLPEADVSWVDGKDQWGYDDYSHAFSAEAMTSYAAQQVAAERERWRAAAVPALAWMEGAWSRIDGEWGPSGKTLDRECTDGDEPEIAALRSRVGRLVDEQKKTMEHKTISVQRFRSPDGAPTCCADHPAGQTCRFLGVRSFGTVDVCMLGVQRDLAPRTTGFQRPDERCEVWADA